MTVLRTSTDGCWAIKSNAWGRYLTQVPDPDADTVITQEQLTGFEVHEDVPKIPSELWQRWINLCVEMTRLDSRNLEVSCRLLRNEADPTLYRIAVPEQSVTVASVRVDSFDKAIDIATGEVIQQWPPAGWRPCGSSHSHNTMDSFFSGTDDKYEIGDPGLHIVVGNIDVQANTYTLAASVTANQRRFLIEPDTVLAPAVDTNVTYHPSVIDVIKLPKQITTGFTSYAPRLTPYKSAVTQAKLDMSLIAGEIETYNEAVDAIILACTQKGLSPEKVLSNLSWDLEDKAYWDSTPLTIDDPFYWSAV